MATGEWAPTGSQFPEACPASGFYCPGHDADVNEPPGSQPIPIRGRRATRTVTVISFSLALEADLAAYDEAAMRTHLAALYNVEEEEVAVTVQPGSLLLLVTLRPDEMSEAEGQQLASAILATSDAALTAMLEVNSTLDATSVATQTVEEEYERRARRATGAPRAPSCHAHRHVEQPDRPDGQRACTPCPTNAFTLEDGSKAESDCICAVGFFAVWEGGRLASIPARLSQMHRARPHI